MVKNTEVGAVRVDEAMEKKKKIGRAERQPLLSPEESRMRRVTSVKVFTVARVAE